MNFVEAMTAAQAGYDTWAAKPHNKKWAKMIYHTPIPNDLLVNIAEAICRSKPAAENDGQKRLSKSLNDMCDDNEELRERVIFLETRNWWQRLFNVGVQP